MKLVAYPLVGVLALLGLIFVTGAQGQVIRLGIGTVLFAAAGFLLWLALQKPKQATTTIVQKIDLSGDVALKGLTCSSCGASLSKEAVSVKAGAVMVHCQYCGATYQIEEQPKW